MAGSRERVYRVDQEQKNSFKRELTFAIFVAVSLCLICLLFLNPAFMKKQVRNSSNQAVITRQVNTHFDDLANVVGDSQGINSNLLTAKQALPITDHIIDYALGIHWFRFDTLPLARQILHDIDLNIDSNSSSEAQQIRHDLKKQKANAPYTVVNTFNLNVISLGANIALSLLIVNVVIIILTVISIVSLLADIRQRLDKRALIHELAASGMWTGFWMILIYGLLSFIPVLFNVESLGIGALAYLIEISSSVFLEFVIVGVVIYILAAIPWQFTSTN